MSHSRPWNDHGQIILGVQSISDQQSDQSIQQILWEFITSHIVFAYQYLLYLSCVGGVGVSVHILIRFFFFSALLIVRLLWLWRHRDTRRHCDWPLLLWVHSEQRRPIFYQQPSIKKNNLVLLNDLELKKFKFVVLLSFSLGNNISRQQILLLWGKKKKKCHPLPRVGESNFLHQRGR